MNAPEAVRRARIASGHTQESLARKTGINKRTIQTWEQGTRQPRVTQLKKVAKALGIRFVIDGMGLTIEMRR